MAERSLWKDEGLDEYEDEEEDDGYGYGYGYEEEEGEGEGEEEDMKPTQEELDYLKIREGLKDEIRRKKQKENAGHGSSTAGSVEEKKAHQTNSGFGSFFGPSVPVIARRVIEESHSSRAETQHHKTSKSSHSHSANKRPPITSNVERMIRPPKPVIQAKTKVEKLKDIRDYSFLLSDDADVPVPLNDPPSRNLHTPSVQVSPKPRVPTSMPSRPLSNGYDFKRPAYSPGQVQQKAGIPKLSNGNENRSKPYGSGPRRPLVHKSMSNSSQSMGLRKPSNTAANRPSSERNNPSMGPDSSKKRYENQRRGMQGLDTMAPPRQLTASPKPSYSRPQQPSSSSKPQLRRSSSNPQQMGYSSNPHRSSQASKSQWPDHTLRPPRPGQSSKPQQQGYPSKPRQPGSMSKPQQSKPCRQVLRQGSNENIVRKKLKPVKRCSDDLDDDDGGNYRSIIRQMFRYNPNKFCDDDDDLNMEANFDEILKEERRSSVIARKEDEEQLRLIEEEEEREKMRKKRRIRG